MPATKEDLIPKSQASVRQGAEIQRGRAPEHTEYNLKLNK